MITYDLHIHSCLSPCSDDEMTPNNIVNMAKVIGLKAIAVCDHNSLRQQKSLMTLANRAGIDYLCGVELETKEEVHVLGYFPFRQIDNVQSWIDNHFKTIFNNPDYFGRQLIMNEKDEIVMEEEKLLLGSLDVSIEECVKMIHDLSGKAVLAHVLNRGNGIIHQLGFIPKGLKVDAIEVNDLKEIPLVLENSPWMRDMLWLCNSDAHRLVDINEANYSLKKSEWDFLRGV